MKKKIDIADLLINRINQKFLDRIDKHMMEAEKILQQMVIKNQNLLKLIDKPDLVLVDGWMISKFKMNSIIFDKNLNTSTKPVFNEMLIYFL